jgi:hypothetical protein
MASDADYMAFLNKANAQRDRATPPEAGAAVKTETVHAGVRVPDVLGEVNAYYISESDEPFEPVVLQWPGASRGLWPDPGAHTFYSSFLVYFVCNVLTR